MLSRLALHSVFIQNAASVSYSVLDKHPGVQVSVCRVLCVTVLAEPECQTAFLSTVDRNYVILAQVHSCQSSEAGERSACVSVRLL